MFEYIKNADLKPARTYTKRKKTDLIVLHHVEGYRTPQQIHTDHLDRGYSGGIAYNIYIDKSGQVYWGRNIEAEGGGVKNSGVSAGVNARCVAIVCNGNYMKETMPAAQLAALNRVTLDVAKHYGLSAEQVKGHREVGNSDCPGKNFPLSEVREYVRQNLKGGSGMYITVRVTEIYRRDSPRTTIGAGNELELIEYSGGKWAVVRNPKTGNEFVAEFAGLKQK